MGFAVAPAFVRATFSQQSKDKAYEMVAEIKQAFKGADCDPTFRVMPISCRKKKEFCSQIA